MKNIVEWFVVECAMMYVRIYAIWLIVIEGKYE